VAEGRIPDVPMTDGDVIRLPASAIRLLPWGVWVMARDLIRVGGQVPIPAL